MDKKLFKQLTSSKYEIIVVIATIIALIVFLTLKISLHDTNKLIEMTFLIAAISIILLLSYTLYCVIYLRFIKHKPATQEEINNIVTGLCNSDISIITQPEEAQSSSLLSPKLYIAYKVTIYDNLNWVDYCAYRVLHKFSKIGFIPIILVRDSKAYKNARVKKEKQEYIINEIRKQARRYISDNAKVVILSDALKKIRIDGETLFDFIQDQFKEARNAINDHGSWYEKRRQEKCSVGIGESHFSLSLISAIVLHKCYSRKNTYLTILQWSATKNLSCMIKQKGAHLLLFNDFTIGGADGKIGAIGRKLYIQPTTDRNIGFKNICTWINNIVKDDSSKDLMLFCYAIRCDATDIHQQWSNEYSLVKENYGQLISYYMNFENITDILPMKFKENDYDLKAKILLLIAIAFKFIDDRNKAI